MSASGLCLTLLLLAVAMLLSVAPGSARNRALNNEFDSSGAGATKPAANGVCPQSPNPPPLGCPWYANKRKPGSQVILRMMQDMTNRMFGGGVSSAIDEAEAQGMFAATY